MSRRWAVAGGGIAGLAAAWELVRARPGEEIVVHEPGRLGGKLRTTPFAGRRVDEGADAFLARVPWAVELCAELGIAGELVAPATGSAYVAVGADLHRIPAGLVLGVPVDPASVRGSPLLGPDAAERVGAEPALPGEPLAPGADESVGSLIRRRFGDDVLERLVDPLVGSINAGDTDRLSVRAAAPQLAEGASRSASLVEGLRAVAAGGGAVDPAAPVFLTPAGGTAVLVERLVAALGAAGVMFASEPVDDPRALGADGVVVATPAPAASAIVGAGGAAEAARLLGLVEHASPVLVTVAFGRGDVRHPLDAAGLLVPRGEGRLLTACSFATTKWAHQAEADPSTVVLRASAGRAGDDRAIELGDDEVVAGVLADLDDLLGIDAEPSEVRIGRWRDGFPQYAPGHLDRLAAAEADLAVHLPGVALAGMAHRGIGIPACIRQGREASRAVVARATSR